MEIRNYKVEAISGSNYIDRNGWHYFGGSAKVKFSGKGTVAVDFDVCSHHEYGRDESYTVNVGGIKYDFIESRIDGREMSDDVLDDNAETMEHLNFLLQCDVWDMFAACRKAILDSFPAEYENDFDGYEDEEAV